MKTLVAVLAFALLGVLLERCNALPREVDLLFRSFQQEPQDAMEDSEEWAENYADDERVSVGKSSFQWSDCGGPRATFRFKGFQMSSTCPKRPGKVTIRYSITSNSDVNAPIKAVMDVKKKVGLIWVGICDRIPGGCERANVCPNGWGDLTFGGLTFAAEEEKAETAEVEGIEGVYNDYRDSILQQTGVCVKKGPSSPPAVTRDIAKAPDGQYSVKANFFTADRKNIACLSVQFSLCK